MRLSTDSDRDEARAEATLLAAVDGGITLFDTAHAYGHGDSEMGHNERLIARALGGHPRGARPVRIVTKGGMRRPGGRWEPDGRARTLREDCEASVEAVGGLPIDLYLLHAPDPRVPWATSVRALAQLVDAGLVRRIGLSNVNRRQLADAIALAPIAAVQVSLGPFAETALRGGVVARCIEAGIEVLAHSPLGGPDRAPKLSRDRDLARIAVRHGVTAQRVALAAVADLHPLVVPVAGARRPETVRACAAALDLGDEDRDVLTRRFRWRDILSPPAQEAFGIVTPSLGGRGGDQCAPNALNSANMALNAHNDDQAHLITRWGSYETPTPDAQSPSGQGGNFLAWFPPVPANMAAGLVLPVVTPLGPNPGSAPNGQPQMGTLIGDFTGMVQGVHEHGCGFQGPNEAFYRFLVQPDPFASIQLAGQTASLSGIDATILQQRADFLRPDSVVAVIVVTQKSESLADPLTVGGQGWVYENSTFLGSLNLAAPEGTIECKQPVDPNNPTTTGPYGPKCTSCALIKNDPNFASRCPNDGAGTDGYLDPTDDALNVRFFHQKLRFGVSVEYPTSRYVRGLTKSAVPDSAHEHDKSGNYVGDNQANCVNPLFATNLPRDRAAGLCALQRGPRTPDIVFYAAIAGVPHQLLQEDPTNPDSPQKDTLTAADWKLINGTDPEHYDFTGTDFHMIESTLPRTAGNLPPGVLNASQCPTDAGDER